MNEQFQLNRTVEDAQPLCQQCGALFTPRAHSGGKPQRFCSPECRSAFHAQRVPTSPTCSDQLKTVATQQPPAQEQPPLSLEAAVKIAAAAHGIPVQREDPDQFDWSDDPDVVLREQTAVAIYRNKYDQVVIRQKAGWDEESDHFVIIASGENLQAFLDKLCDVAGIPSFPPR